MFSITVADEERTVLETPVFSVSLRKVGGIEDFATVHHPGAVAILAHDDQYIYLTRQFRPAVERYVIELPAGTCEPHEDAIATAARELQEEIGKRAKNLSLLTTFFSSPGYCDERVLLFEAWGLEDVEAEGDPDEAIEVIKWPLQEIDAAINRASTAKTIVGLCLFQRGLTR